MTRSERLLFLIRMMRDHRGVTLREMSARCRVSPRTLYRDFRTLSSLNYTIRFDHGYRLIKGAVPAPIGISADEVQTVRMVFRIAPLRRYIWLRKQIVAIDAKLAVGVSEQLAPDHVPCIAFGEDFQELNELPSHSLVCDFLKAIKNRKRVVITRTGEPPSNPLTPVSVLISADGPIFSVESPGEAGETKISAVELSRIRICPR